MVTKYHTGSRLGHVILRGFFLHPMRGGYWRNRPMKEREASKRNYDEVSGPILKIIKGFQTFKFIFSSTRHLKNL
jgi:hypothetical protein